MGYFKRGDTKYLLNGRLRVRVLACLSPCGMKIRKYQQQKTHPVPELGFNPLKAVNVTVSMT
jgi:hypothetical protein